MIPVTPEKLEQLIHNAEAEGVPAEKILPLRNRLEELRSGVFLKKDTSKVRYKEVKSKSGQIVYYSTASTLTDNDVEEDEFEGLEMRAVEDSSSSEKSINKVIYSYPKNPQQ
ncbi:MAG: hypothetical protein J7647_03880 [Cyanobacteria bacterium SBLK]|nr:hypothetical protein [Cyanobacteria bacterium SBLK]